VDGGELLPDIFANIKRFIICDDETALAAALWTIATWFVDDVQVAPIALITAPDKQCGKTQLLTVLSKLAYRSMNASNITAAAMFRTIDKYSPITVFIDEADSFLNENNELRGVINSGHTRDTAFTFRCVGDSHESKDFSTWGFKAIAGIGKPPPTIALKNYSSQHRG
jgi:putative DNA primase/helicase